MVGANALMAIRNINQPGFNVGVFLIVVGVGVICLAVGYWIWNRK